MKEPIIIGSDHAGFKMKEFIKSELEKTGVPYNDIGTHSIDSTDYPLYAGKIGKEISKGNYQRGIAICGAGIGASIAANRFRGVRAALCLTEEMAYLSREHNDSNVLVLGGRITSTETASKILKAWLETPFAGGRHSRRIEMLDTIVDKQ
ncbi:MAG: ribose 5-phosphate isomerase B [Fibrobacterota bacterium]